MHKVDECREEKLSTFVLIVVLNALHYDVIHPVLSVELLMALLCFGICSKKIVLLSYIIM